MLWALELIKLHVGRDGRRVWLPYS